MCDIRFFKSAYHCYDVAANLLKYYEQDELYLNDVAYNLQQCVEKTLRAFLECKGVTIPQTHSIHKLISMSEKNGSVVTITDWIIQNQYEIETWEADTRHNFDISLELGRIQQGLREVLLREAAKNSTQNKLQCSHINRPDANPYMLFELAFL